MYSPLEDISKTHNHRIKIIVRILNTVPFCINQRPNLQSKEVIYFRKLRNSVTYELCSSTQLKLQKVYKQANLMNFLKIANSVFFFFLSLSADFSVNRFIVFYFWKSVYCPILSSNQLLLNIYWLFTYLILKDQLKNEIYSLCLPGILWRAA